MSSPPLVVGERAKKSYTERNEQRVDHDESRLLAYAVGHGHSQRDTHHVGHLANTQEETRVEEYRQREHHDVLLAPDNVGKEERNGGSAHGVEEVEAERRSVEQPPGLIGHQSLEVIAKRGGGHSLDALAGELEAEQKQHEATRSDDAHGHLPRRLGRHAQTAAEHGAQRVPRKEGYERASVGKKTCGRTKTPSSPASCRSSRRAWLRRDIYARVDGHHEYVGHIGPHELGTIGPVGGGEKQDAAYRERSGHPQQIGTVFAPACARAVGGDAHHRVAHCVPYAGDQEEYACVDKAYSEDVGIEKG